MPAISMFFGIIIRMFVGRKEHNPPHFHAYYQDATAIFDIRSGDLIEGNLPRKQVRLIQAWAEIYRDELLADWNLASNNDEPFKIDPLK